MADLPSTLVKTAAPRRARRRVTGTVYLSAAWLIGLTLLAILAPVLGFIQDPAKVNVGAIGSGPTARHWLGADELGRDIFARVVFGARSSLAVSTMALILAAAVGVTLGTLAGYFRGLVETVIMFLCDVVLSVPGLVLVLALVAFLGAGIPNLVGALALLAVPGLARLTRAQVLTLAERDYVLAARAMGARHGRIILREILPAALLPLTSLALLMVGLLIVVAGALDFLGAGVPPPTPTWGGMIASGVTSLARTPLVSLVPSAVLFATILAANTIGDSLRSGLELRESVL